jgi:hypothetical protein
MTGHLDLVPVGEIAAERVEGALQAEVLEDGRVQFPGEGVDVVGEIDQLRFYMDDPLPQGRIALLGLDLQGAGLDGERG